MSTWQNPLQDDLEHIQAHAAPDLWEPLRGQAVFLTGGTGFFGWWLLESFAHVNRALDLNAHVTVLTRDPAKFRQRAPHLAADPAIRLVAGDIRTVDAAAIDAPYRFPFFIHAAASSDAREYTRDPLGAVDTIVLGTRAALTLARETGTRRFLFVSSGAVYGPQPADISHLPETFLSGAPDCADPGALYAEGKRMAENYCACAHRQHGLETLTARAFAFVGPGLPLDQHFAIGNFIDDALAGRPIRIDGDGTPWRSYLYAADLALWLWTILLRGTAGRVYNVGSEAGAPLSEVAETVARCAGGPSLPVQIARPPEPDQPPSRYVPDVSRIKHELGVRETFDLDAAVRRTLAWHRRTCPPNP